MQRPRMLRLAVALSLAVLMGHGPSTTQATPVRSESPLATHSADVRADTNTMIVAAKGGIVDAEMRNVDFQIDSGIVLHISRLRGLLAPTIAGTPPTFDDKRSFTLVMHSADIAIDTTSLAILLNRHVFGYPGAPLRKLRLRTEGGQLVQSGVLRKGINMPFRIKATVALMPDGRIRLHPTSVRVLGIGVTNLMDFFGVELANMIKLRGGRGASIDGNDFILDPEAMLPPPQIRGRLTSIAVGDGAIRQTFGAGPGQDARPLRASSTGTPNYMYFRHGTLRFGKLTMVDADLLIVDDDASDIFDFSLDRYNDQLVAGYSKSTTDLGLVVYMPDLGAVGARRGTKPARQDDPGR